MPVLVVESNEELVLRVAEYLKQHIHSCLNQLPPDKYVTVALSGGSMPSIVCPAIRHLRLQEAVWSRVRFVFTDERLVPYESADSTWGVYWTALFGAQSVPGLQRHCFLAPDTAKNAEECAEDYSKQLQELCQLDGQGKPVLDIVLLGMGPDGHTASLFPEHPLLKATTVAGSVLDSPKPPLQRVTLTLPTINRARHVAFIATGSAKNTVLKEILEPGSTSSLPAALVQPANGVTWFVDDSAIHDVQLPK